MRRAVGTMLCAAALACAGPTAAESGTDVVILMDASAMTALSAAAEEAPWFACPCLNPEHFYLRPAEINKEALALGVTFPEAETVSPAEAMEAELAVYDAALKGWVVLSAAREYRFTHSFMAEPEARGWRPWRYHFMRSSTGAPVRIDCTLETGCYGRADTAKALARAIAEGVLGAGEGNRVAFCAFGEAGSSRWSCPLTGDIDQVVACMEASPIQQGGDHAAALSRALRLLNRRSLMERLGRRAVVVILSGGEVFPAGNAMRAMRLAEMLKDARGMPHAPAFGAALTEAERQGAGAQVIAVGLWDGGSAFLDAMASGEDARFALEESETAEAVAAAVLKRIFP